MALPQTVTAGQAGHLADHDEIHELLAGSDAYINVAGFASLQAAHDALPAAGGVLYFPPGLQLTPTATTTISKPCAIVGSPDAKLIQGGNSFFNLLTVNAVDRFWLVGMHLDGRLDVGRTADGDLIALSGACPDARIVDNRLTNCHGALALSANDFTDLRVERNRVVNSFYAGLNINGRVNRAWICDNYIDTTQSGGIFFDDLASGEQINVTVSGNQIVDPQRQGGAGKAGIQTYGSTSNRHRRFKIAGNTVTFLTRGGGGTGDCVSIGLDQITDSVIQGNHTRNPDNGEGIITLGYGNDILGNRVEGVSASAIGMLSYGGEQQITNVNVVGNICRGFGTTADHGNGITWVANAVAGQDITGVHVASNRCYNGSFGVLTYNDGGTMNGSNNSVIGNNLTGNGTAASFVANSGQTTAANLPTI